MAAVHWRRRLAFNDKGAHGNASWLFLGMIDFICGIVGLGASVIAMPATVIFCVSLLVVVAILFAASSFRQKRWRSLVYDLAAAAFYGVAGSVLTCDPIASAVWLRLVIAASLLAAGICHVLFAVSGKVERWGWMLIDGLHHRRFGHHDLNSIVAVGLEDEWADCLDRDDSRRLASADNEA
jgi:uncharacterized membrane protein HdeD (DUF308 family)